MNKIFPSESDHPLFRYFTERERGRVEGIAQLRRIISEALAFDPQLLAKFAVAMSELLVERLRDTARRV